MSNIKQLQNEIERLRKILLPAPTVIHCGQAHAELLAMLEAQMTEEQRHTPVEWTEEQLSFAEDLDALLDTLNKRTEETCNVKLV